MLNKIFNKEEFSDAHFIGESFYCKVDQDLRFRATFFNDCVEFAIINRLRGVVDKLILSATENTYEDIAVSAKEYIAVYNF